MARPKSSDNEARRKLIDAAERLFSESGFDGVSIREIADAAGVNVALIAYYFGGKAALFTEAFRRSAVPINEDRLAMLRDIRQRGGRPQLRELVLAWLEPVFRYDSNRKQRHLFIRLSTLLTDRKSELFEKLEAEIHHTVNEQFIDALSECLPHLSRDTLLWRLYFVIAATAIATRGSIPGVRARKSAGGATAPGIYRNLQPLVDFAEAGLSAPESVSHPAKAAPQRKRTGTRSSSPRRSPASGRLPAQS
jgi:AcrR family transcriptional regulator